MSFFKFKSLIVGYCVSRAVCEYFTKLSSAMKPSDHIRPFADITLSTVEDITSAFSSVYISEIIRQQQTQNILIKNEKEHLLAVFLMHNNNKWCCDTYSIENKCFF